MKIKSNRMDEEEMIYWYDENQHHLFTKDEIRGRLIDVFEPATEEDYKFINKEIVCRMVTI